MSSGQAGYYLELACEDYYVNGGEPQGQWLGFGADALGLSGDVQPDQLYNLFDGLSADGTRSLIQRQRHQEKADHRPGWDLTFSAPKSVSVLWSQTSPENRQLIQAAHHAAVKAALDYLQDTAAYTRRGSGGSKAERAGLIIATFEHSTSRALDPQLHTHALVLNVGVRRDGTTGTINSLPLFLSKMAAGALYRSELAARLENDLGIPIARKRSWFEVLSVPKRLVDEFSKRREAIEETLSRKGLSTPEASAVAALETRVAKESVSRERMFAGWQADGAAHGWSTSKADRLFDAHRPSRNLEKEAREVLDIATKRLTERSAHFSKREFLCYCAEESQGRGLDASAIRQLTEDHLSNSPDIVRLGMHRGQARFTTKNMLKLERSLLADAAALQSDEHLRVSAHDVIRQLANHGELSEEQAKALWHITHETGGLSIVSGMAGTGKTKMLEVARATWESQGFTVQGGALASRAATELSEGAGMESATIAKLLLDIARGKRQLDAKTIVVVDEAGMVATPDMEKLAKHARQAGAKLVLIGDEKQLQPIGPGAPFKELGHLYGQVELTDIRRQNDAWAKKAAKDFAAGRSLEALAAFAERGMVNVTDTKAEASRELIKAWRGDRLPTRDTLIIAATNDEVRALNRLAQDARIAAGELSGPSASVNGERWFVGDRIIFTENRRTLGVNNGDKATIESVLGQGVRVRLDSGKRVSFDPLSLGVALGYATTTHKAQGATATRAYVLTGGPMQDREISYVQGSRARDRTTFFVTRSDVGDTIANLAREMARSRQKDMAHAILRKHDHSPEQELER